MKRKFFHFKASSLRALGIAALAGVALTCCHKDKKVTPGGISQVNHVVVIYLENHSFDNLYGQFSGANGLSNATASNTTQVDATGTAYTSLPPIPGTSAFPTNLANTYFNIDQYIPADQETPDVLHRYYQEQIQIDGGKMDKYSAYNSNSAGLSQGYYSTNLLPLLPLAQKYVICDN